MSINTVVVREIPFVLLARPDLPASQRQGVCVADFSTAEPLSFGFTFLLDGIDEPPAVWTVGREGVTAAVMNVDHPLSMGDFQAWWGLSNTELIVRLAGQDEVCSVSLPRQAMARFIMEVESCTLKEQDDAVVEAEVDNLLAEIFAVEVDDWGGDV